MDQYLDFMEVFGPYLFHNLEWPKGMEEVKAEFYKQWVLLRKGVLFVMRYHDGQHTPQRIQEARLALAQYGEAVEKVHFSLSVSFLQFYG